MMLASTGPSGVSHVFASPAAEVGGHRRVQVIAVGVERRGVGGAVGLVDELHVIRVGRVLDDHLRMHLDPVHHPRVRVKRVVLVGFELGKHRRLPVGGPAVALVPHHDEAVPLLRRSRILIFTFCLQPILLYGISAFVPSPRHSPAVPRADDVLTLDGAADAHVGAEVLTVGVEHVDRAGLGAEDHQFFAEVVGALDLAGSQLRGEADDEPAGREPVLRQADPAGPNSRSDGSIVESEIVSVMPTPSARTIRAGQTLSIVYCYYFKHSRSRTAKPGAAHAHDHASRFVGFRLVAERFSRRVSSPSCVASGRSFTTSSPTAWPRPSSGTSG